jgi:hypothetical protein
VLLWNGGNAKEQTVADPITVGALIAGALALGSEALKGVVGEATKDAYGKLKETLVRAFPGLASSVIEKPSSKPRADALAEEIEGLNDQDKTALQALAKEVIERLRSDKAAKRTIGAKIDILVSEGLLRIGEIEASGDATGLEAKEIRGQTVEVGNISARASRGN